MYLCIMSIFEINIDKIRKLCVSHYVDYLYVFGSILTGKFSINSDIDMGVNFSGVNLFDYADNYFNFKLGLEEILEREVDLLENDAIKNPFLRKSVDASKQVIYAN